MTDEVRWSLNYKLEDGMVFVDFMDGDYPSWKRMTLEEAEAQGLSKDIVKCYTHGKPIISLDHHYPLYNDKNKCEDCGK